MAEAKFSSANATAFAAGILRSFVVDNGQAKCKLLTWSNQEFNDWKDNGNLASLNDVIGRPVTKSGGTIKLKYQATANHKGYFLVKLCKNNNIRKDTCTQADFDK